LSFECHLTMSPARLEARMDLLFSFPLGLFPVLCGGRSAMIVPTASTDIRSRLLKAGRVIANHPLPKPGADTMPGMPKASSHLPPGFSTLSIHLTLNGAAKYIEFLKQAFDAVELTRSASPDGRLLNASVRIGDSVMMLNDVFPEFGGKPIVP